ncbi:MAG TPA: sigma 54-interacting transcriptional regulator [Pyrinomonadaceae bacterium]|nr:sigma 54-interacting transcriptional regulator [Pyrinomonadaceae bacterium]
MRPLEGRTVVVTRALAQAAEFAAELEGYGARVVACPTIEIVEPESYAELDEAIENLFGYDWLVFTSANGVDFFLRRLAALGRGVNDLDELRVCAVGTATAERLTDAHVHVDVVPEEFRAEGVFSALESYLGGREKFDRLNFLLPRASAGRDFLPRALGEAGARVDAVTAYRTVPPRTTDRAKVEALLVGGGVDCVTFASPSAVKNFARLFDTHDLAPVLGTARVACIGEVTARTAADHGLRVDIRPAESTAAALARAVADFFAAEPRPPIAPPPCDTLEVMVNPPDSIDFEETATAAAGIGPDAGERPAEFPRTREQFGKLVGASDPMQRVYTLVEQVASSSASVLLTGESGTGKEMVARTIHELSPRRDAEFVAINCSAIPETLMESELFGHERGSFTGASSRRVGCFELANRGTLLLDEIAEMPTPLQAKLLRVLEERTVRRLGGSQEIPVDVRVLAATNRDPQDAVRSGSFREDLLYRLNVITIELPPLRQRKDDLPLLAGRFVESLAARHGRPARRLSPAALEVLRAHHWPGNVRELRNVIERAVIICSGDTVERHHIAPYPLDQRARARSEDTVMLPVGTPLEEVERQMILRTLQKTDNNKTRAAELLQISLKTLHNKLRLYRERGLLPEFERKNLPPAPKSEAND